MAPKFRVDDELDRVLDRGSPLMKRAETQGMKRANARGLTNSSLAVGEAQKAVMDKALPIARDNAGFNFERWRQDDQQAFQGGQADLDRALRERVQRRDITSQERMQRRDIGSQERMQGRDISAEREFRAADRGQDRINAQADFVTRLESVYANQYQSIMENPNLPAEEREQQIRSIQSLRNQQLNYVNQLYDPNFRYRWDTGSSGGQGQRNANSGGSSRNRQGDSFLQRVGRGADGRTPRRQSRSQQNDGVQEFLYGRD
jgi:hypothetical protein